MQALESCERTNRVRLQWTQPRIHQPRAVIKVECPRLHRLYKLIVGNDEAVGYWRATPRLGRRD
jgi:hypothetical protein